MVEVFKDIPEFEGYQASNLGRIKSFRCINERILKLQKNVCGYYMVQLRRNGNTYARTVHKLVAMTFLNHKREETDKLVIDHINHNHRDNRVENLQIITHRENSSKDKFRYNTTSKYVGVHRYKGRFKADIRINGKKTHLGTFDTEKEASKYYQNAVNSLKDGENIKIKKPVYSSAYLGVRWEKSANKWRAVISGKHIGLFKNEYDAYLAY